MRVELIAATKYDSEEINNLVNLSYRGEQGWTRETGIVMLADAVEAVTRTIEDPTPAKLETQIDEIIKARFLDGELDECDLTLKDLIKIKQSFLLTGTDFVQKSTTEIPGAYSVVESDSNKN